MSAPQLRPQILRSVAALAAVVSIDLGLAHATIQSDTAQIVVFIVLISQATLAVLWLMLGADHWALRLTVAAGIAGGVFATLIHPHQWLWIHLGAVFSLSAFAGVLRAAGVRLLGADEVSQSTRLRPVAAQFTMRDLLLVTALAAVVFACLVELRADARGGLAWLLWLGVLLSVVAVMALWATLVASHWRMATAAAISTSALLGWGLYWSVFPNANKWTYFELFAGLAAVQSGLLLLLRRRGFRVGRPTRLLAGDLPSEPPAMPGST